MEFRKEELSGNRYFPIDSQLCSCETPAQKAYDLKKVLLFFVCTVLHCNVSSHTGPTVLKLSPLATQSLILLLFLTVFLRALSLGLCCLEAHPSLM